MTDNERLFGPMRRVHLEPIWWADCIRRAINAPPRLDMVAVVRGDEVRIHARSHAAALRGYRQ